MSEDDKGQGAADRPQDPRVQRLRPDPAEPPRSVRTLEGMWGDSDREGYRRLYLTADLDYYAEFRADDVISAAAIPQEERPFLGDQATRVTLAGEAVVEFTRTRRAAHIDPFDIDVRSARPSSIARPVDTMAPAGCFPETMEPAGCPGQDTFFGCSPGGGTFGCPTGQITVCKGNTCNCETRRHTWCENATCETCTCATCAGQGTCATCHTCQTCPGVNATCQTCNTCRTCNQATCNTCNTCAETQCGTCRFCDTTNPHICADAL